MNAVRCIKLASVFIGFCALTFSLASQATSQSASDDEPPSPKIRTHGDAKKIIIKNRVEVLELRGARTNPNFLEESFHQTEVNDAARWNHQHEHINEVKGLKAGSRSPASVVAKSVKRSKPVTDLNVAKD